MKKQWKYRLAEQRIFELPELAGISYRNAWVVIANGRMKISAGYAWDGCSPKYQLMGLWSFGTPDGVLREGEPWLYEPSLVHDVLCQFRAELPVTKAQSVRIFNDMMVDRNWPLRRLYTWAVDKLGPQDWASAPGRPVSKAG